MEARGGSVVEAEFAKIITVTARAEIRRSGGVNSRRRDKLAVEGERRHGGEEEEGFDLRTKLYN